MKTTCAVVLLSLIATLARAESALPATSFKWNVFLNSWQVAGPFTPSNPVSTEAEAALCNEGKWKGRARPFSGGVLNLNAAFGSETNADAYAYAWTRFTGAEEQDAVLAFGVDDGMTAWLNGRKILERPGLRPCYLDEFSTKAHLVAGANLLVLKVQNGPSDWGAVARLLPAAVEKPLMQFHWSKIPPLGAFELYANPDLKVEFLDEDGKLAATHFVSGFRMFDQKPPWYLLYAAAPDPLPAKVRVSFRQSGFMPFEKTVDWDEALRAPVIIDPNGQYKITGHVVDDDTDEPLPGVVISTPQGSIGEPSNATGEFSFDNIDPRLHTLMAAKAGYATTVATVAAPFARPVKFALSRGGRVVEGTVTDEAGNPVANAKVSLLNVRNVDPQADTDADGNFKIVGLPKEPAAFWIFIIHPDFVPEKFNSYHRERIFRLQRAAVVTGKIVSAEDHQPLGGIHVLSPGPKELSFADAYTDQDGNYRLTGVMPGSAPICVDNDDFAPGLQRVAADVGTEKEANFELEAGATVTGRVFDDENKPVPGARILAHPWVGLFFVYREVYADANGEFSLPHMPLTSTPIHVNAPNRPLIGQVSVTGGHDYQITLEPPR